MRPRAVDTRDAAGPTPLALSFPSPPCTVLAQFNTTSLYEQISRAVRTQTFSLAATALPVSLEALALGARTRTRSVG
jgi:hypothetical protein